MSKSEEFRDEIWLLMDQAFSSLYTSTVETHKENIIKSIELFIVNLQQWTFCADFFIWFIENFSYILIESGFNQFHTRIISSCTTLINTLSDNPVTFNVAFNTLRQIVQTILNNYNEITSGKCTKVSVSLDICIPYGIKNDFSTIPLHQNSLMSSLLTCFYEVCCQNRELIMSCSSSCISEMIICLMKLLDFVQGDYKLNVAKMLILFISKTSTELSMQEWKVVCSQFTSFNYDQDIKNVFFDLLEILQYKNNIPNINLLLLQSVLHFINTECIANKNDITKWINLGTSYIELISNDELGQIDLMPVLCHTSSYQRHHKVKHLITEMLRKKNYTCLEEVYAVDEEGSARYADIIAFPENSKVAYILDPTVRFESNDPDQALKVDQEKQEIYRKCTKFYGEKFQEQFGRRDYEVHGLWFGARGSIPSRTLNFFQSVGIDLNKETTVTEEIILDSLAIISHHIYT